MHKMTNFEKIKAMSVEEMAEEIYTNVACRSCNLCPAEDICADAANGCIHTIEKYLESEVEENG